MLTNYEIDGWVVRFPQEWQMSLDREAQPPQVIFETDGGAATVYVSTWSFRNRETGETADAETVAALLWQACETQGLRRAEGFSGYAPSGFPTLMGESLTSDGCRMLSCFVCTTGGALSVYIVCAAGADFETYLPYLRTIAREER